MEVGTFFHRRLKKESHNEFSLGSEIFFIIFTLKKTLENQNNYFSSIFQVYEVGKKEAITVDMVTKEFKSQFKDEDIDKVFGADSEYDFLKRVCTVYYMYLLGLGQYSHYRYNIDTEINRYV